MFPILGPDYEIVSGERRYKPTDPSTVVSAEDMNQVVLSLHRIITASGLTLNANNAAEVSANWGQLLQAVLRLSHQHPSTLIQVAEIDTGAGFEIALGDETRILSITEDGSQPYAPFNIDDNLSTYERRELIIRNDSGSPKIFSMGDSRYLDLMPGQCARVFCMFGGGVTWWRSLNAPERVQVTFTARALASSVQSSRQGYVVNGNGYTHLLIPYFNLALTSAEANIELYIPNLAMPWIQSTPPNPRRIAAQAVGYGDDEEQQTLVGTLDPALFNSSYLGLGYETRAIYFTKQSGAGFTAPGLAGLDAQVITIRNQYP